MISSTSESQPFIHKREILPVLYLILLHLLTTSNWVFWEFRSPPHLTRALSCRTLIPRTAPFPLLTLHVSNALFVIFPHAKSKSSLYPKHERVTGTHPKRFCPHKVIFKQGVCHTLALSFTLKSVLRQKKNYRNSNISSCKNIIFKKSSKILQNIIMNL